MGPAPTSPDSRRTPPPFRRPEHRFSRLLTLAPILFLALFALDNLRAPTLVHPEAYGRIVFYGTSAGRGLRGELEKIFDYRKGESYFFGEKIYRARLLNYAFDLLDAKSLRFLNAFAPYGARSASHFLLTALAVLSLFFAFKSLRPGLPASSAALLAAFPATFPQLLVQNGFYFRPAKILSFFTAAFLFLVWTKLRTTDFKRLLQDKKKFILWLISVGLLGLLTTADEQAIVMVAVFLLLMIAVSFRTRNFLPVLSFLLPALYFAVHTLFIDPWLAAKFAGLKLDGGYPNPLRLFTLAPGLLTAALSVSLYQLQAVFGDPLDSGRWALAALALALFLLLGRRVFENRRRTKNAEPLGDILRPPLALLACLFAAFYAMTVRHPPIVAWPDLTRGGYYYLPLALCFYLCFVHVLHRLGFLGKPANRVLLACVLILWAVGNFLAAASARQVIATGHLGAAVELQARMRKDLARPVDDLERAATSYPPGERLFLHWYRTHVGKTF